MLAGETPDYTMPVRIGAAEAETAGGFRYYRAEHRADGQWVGAALPDAVAPDLEGDYAPHKTLYNRWKRRSEAGVSTGPRHLEVALRGRTDGSTRLHVRKPKPLFLLRGRPQMTLILCFDFASRNTPT